MISPCVRICTMDPDAGLCEGCGRTIDEIANWMRMDEAERAAVMDVLPARLKAKRAAEMDADLRLPPAPAVPGGWRSR